MRVRGHGAAAWALAAVMGVAGAMGVTATAGCEAEPGAGGGDGGSDEFTAAEVARYSKLSPLPALPADPTNKYADNADAAKLGQRLFFEKTWAGALKRDSDLGKIGDKGKVACATCHNGPAFDQRQTPNNVALAADYHKRNAPPMVNSPYYKWTNWAGRFDSQWSLPLAVLESGVIFNTSRLRAAHVVFDKYKADYEAIFGTMPALDDAQRFPAEGKPKAAMTDPDGAWEGMAPDDQKAVNRVLANVGKALEAYTRKLTSHDSPFDKFVAGDRTAMSASARRGLKLFIGKAACVACHDNPHFSDDDFHVTGVPQTGPNVPMTDDGRAGDVPGLLSSPFNGMGAYSDDTTAGAMKLMGIMNPAPASAKGAFRTKGLREVSETGPFMHAGQFATLEDVVEFYNRGGDDNGNAKDSKMVPLNLADGEKADLVEFLKTLTGQAVSPDLTMDTSAQ